ncbi:MAG: outer membrane beta-barrel protein [Verrucomicrobiota bacterium]
MRPIPFLVGILITALILFFALAQSQAQDDYYYSPPPSSYAGKPSAFDGISYDFFDIGYRYFTFDDAVPLDNSHGFEANLSFDFLWLFFLETGFTYTNAKADADSIGDVFDFDTDTNYTRFEIGPGIHIPLHPKFHLVGSVGWQYTKQDLDFDKSASELFDDFRDGSGIYVKPGVRIKFNDYIELDAFAEWHKAARADDGVWGASTDLIFWPAKWIGISGHAEFREDVNTYGIGLRFSWD